MLKYINLLTKFIEIQFKHYKRYYLFVIFIVLLISYGQILFMLPWQDDNAMFFKLAHIREPAGFLGNGMLGEGAYKYTAFFYYPIYLLVKYQIPYYFLFCFVMYSLSTYVVYKVVSKIFDENSGMLAGFLYVCGFIGSDSYIRLFNSIITSLSVILVCLFLNSYWSYYKTKKIKWYLFGLAFFFMAAEFARARTHYLVLVVFLFELVFLTFKKPFIKSITATLLRLSPMLLIFYRYVIAEDFRSKEGGIFLSSILHGDFYKIYGFLSTLPNLILPSWLINLLSPASSSQAAKNYLSNSVFYFVIIGTSVVLLLFYIFYKYKKTRTYIAVFVILSVIWKYISSIIFITPFLIASSDQILFTFIGGELILLASFGLLLINKKYKALYLVIFSGILINLLSYSAYNPTQVYEKINRYLSHSFLYFVMFSSLIYFSSKEKAKKIILLALLLWGSNNLIEGFLYQRNILSNRTEPVRAFYKEFTRLVEDVKKNDIIYFDVADNVRSQFADAFSVAQMPDTTAIAWRYGIDRDDFLMFQDPEELFKYLEENPLNGRRVRTFFYSKAGLVDTTNNFLKYLNNERPIDFKTDKSSELILNEQADAMYIGKTELEISDNIKIPSLVPVKLNISLIAKPLDIRQFKFPIYYGLENTTNSLIENTTLSTLAFRYAKFRDSFNKNQVLVSSDWRGRVGNNLIDNDTNSTWQADRLLWLKDEQYLIIKMQNEDSFDRFSFTNSYSDNSLLDFDMFYAQNLSGWKSLGSYKNSKRLGNNEAVTVDFKPTNFKYFKIKFNKTLNGDSPAISELLLIPTMFSSLNLKETYEYLRNPFAIISDFGKYSNLLRNTSLIGDVDLYWMNNKNFGWQSSVSTKAKVIFDGKEHSYNITIPAGGTEINKLEFISTNFPGELKVTKIKVSY